MVYVNWFDVEDAGDGQSYWPLQMLAVTMTTICSHIHVGSRALREVRHLVDVFLFEPLSTFQMVCKETFISSCRLPAGVYGTFPADVYCIVHIGFKSEELEGGPQSSQ